MFLPLSSEEAPRATVPTSLLTILTLTMSSLPALYAIVVHSFLSFFHERSFTARKHWKPIFLRLLFCCWHIFAHWDFLLVKSTYDDMQQSRVEVGHFWTGFTGDVALLLTVSACPFTSSEWLMPVREAYLPASIVVIVILHYIEVITKQSMILQYQAAALQLGLSIFTSSMLIIETRRKEVDGPKPSLVTPCKAFLNCPISIKDKVILITGANTGIGLETAKQLYNHGAIIVLACRSRERAMEAMEIIDPTRQKILHNDEETMIEQPQKRLFFLPLDLTDTASIRKAVDTFTHQMNIPKLHVLINNAGVMRKNREESADGFEMTIAVNHLGHFLLTNLLLPKLRQTAMEEGYPSKVITLSSSLYCHARRRKRSNEVPSWKKNMEMDEYGIDFDDLQCQKKRYALFDQYAQSKLANLLFAKELRRREQLRAKRILQKQQRLEQQGVAIHTFDANGGGFNHENANLNHVCPVLSYALHPGLVRTNVVRDMPWYLYYPNIIFAFFLAILQKTPKSGAYTSVFCAMMNVLNESCLENEFYYVNSERSMLTEAAKNDEDAQRLWALSCNLMQVPVEE